MSDFPNVRIEINLVTENDDDSKRLYLQTFHRAYLNSLPNDWLQALIAMLNNLEKRDV